MESSPSWLNESCPRWCLREHGEDDHPEDREHRGDAVVISVLASGADDVAVDDLLRPTELVVQLHRRVGAVVEWVSIEPAQTRQPRLALTRGSARALADALRRADGRPGSGPPEERSTDLSSG